jgi:hypothetical protein
MMVIGALVPMDVNNVFKTTTQILWQCWTHQRQISVLTIMTAFK